MPPRLKPHSAPLTHSHTHSQLPHCVHSMKPRGRSIITGARDCHWSRCLISLLQGVCCAAVSDPIPSLLPASFDRVKGHAWDGCSQLGWDEPSRCLSAFKNYYHHWDVNGHHQKSFNHRETGEWAALCWDPRARSFLLCYNVAEN